MQKLFQSISADAGYRMEVVLKKTIEISASKGFSKKELFMAFRRLSKDYEITTSSAETIISHSITLLYRFVLSCRRVLIKYGPNVIKVQNKQGDTPLHIAATLLCNEEIIQYLVQKVGCDINAQNEVGETALHIAVKISSNAKIIGYLKRAGRTVDKKNNTVLHTAARIANNEEMIKCLLELAISGYIDANAQDDEHYILRYFLLILKQYTV